MLNRNICPTCKTVISKEQKQALTKSHHRGGGIGLALGLLGAGLGVYFGMAA